jgi:hypothetical protein
MGNVAADTVGIGLTVGVYVGVAKRYFVFIGEGVVRVNTLLTLEKEIVTVEGYVPGVAIYYS